MSKMKDLTYDIEAMFIDGDSPATIAEQLGCPVSLVKRTLETFGVDVRDLEDEVYSPYNAQVDTSPFWAYNTCIMKLNKRMKMKAKATRAHYVLFCEGTPFKQKRVESKVKFKRNPKHKGSRNAD